MLTIDIRPLLDDLARVRESSNDLFVAFVERRVNRVLHSAVPPTLYFIVVQILGFVVPVEARVILGRPWTLFGRGCLTLALFSIARSWIFGILALVLIL
jgi:hypothetical protein